MIGSLDSIPGAVVVLVFQILHVFINILFWFVDRDFAFQRVITIYKQSGNKGDGDQNSDAKQDFFYNFHVFFEIEWTVSFVFE